MAWGDVIQLNLDVSYCWNMSTGINGFLTGAEWPPPLIFDVAYGCAALKTWRVAAFVDFA
jgi:hypothetical protein